jgi:hypothetical protein
VVSTIVANIYTTKVVKLPPFTNNSFPTSDFSKGASPTFKLVLVGGVTACPLVITDWGMVGTAP